MSSVDQSTVYDIAIVGTGIHGMHLYIRLGTEDAFKMAHIVTIDPWETPLHLWTKRTSNTTMKYLRSPASHGLHPRFPSIRRFERKMGNLPREIDPFVPPYHRPALDLFNSHADNEIQQTQISRKHYEGVVASIGQTGHLAQLYIRRRRKQPISLRAKSVVLAVGQPPLHIPPPFERIADRRRIVHIYSTRFTLSNVTQAGSTAIVGGGIASIHLALFLADHDIPVDVWCPRIADAHQFDSDPCYIGPRCGTDFKKITSYECRRAVINRERRNGSIPPDLARKRDAAVSSGKIRLITDLVHRAQSDDDGVTLANETVTKRYSCVVLATGFGAGPPAATLIDQTARQFRLPRGGDGYPILDKNLRWTSPQISDGPHLFCMGALSDLELGPPARNIIGAHLAGRRIVPALKRITSR